MLFIRKDLDSGIKFERTTLKDQSSSHNNTSVTKPTTTSTYEMCFLTVGLAVSIVFGLLVQPFSTFFKIRIFLFKKHRPKKCNHFKQFAITFSHTRASLGDLHCSLLHSRVYVSSHTLRVFTSTVHATEPITFSRAAHLAHVLPAIFINKDLRKQE